MERLLPTPFRPKLHRGHAIAGICLIRLEQIRPKGLPPACGFSSENAAHRNAVLWSDASGQEQEGVFVPRRDTDSRLNHWAGGRIFPGEHHLARFAASDDRNRVEISLRSDDGGADLAVVARAAKSLPASSCFHSLEEASSFFESGRVGYSVTRDCCRFDGLQLQVREWRVQPQPLDIDRVESSFFGHAGRFPQGSIAFDHALMMRDVAHEWHHVPDLAAGPQGIARAFGKGVRDDGCRARTRLAS